MGPTAACTCRTASASPGGSSLVTSSRPTNLRRRAGRQRPGGCSLGKVLQPQAKRVGCATAMLMHSRQRELRVFAARGGVLSPNPPHLRSSVGPLSSCRHSARPAAACSGVGAGGNAALRGGAACAATPASEAESVRATRRSLDSSRCSRKPVFIAPVYKPQSEGSRWERPGLQSPSGQAL